ncbi:MAG: hypothetical protein GX597_08980 [Anaerolineaceae bacterium]|nr:hypothetical protein [Anaerolineaceae bacterium]
MSRTSRSAHGASPPGERTNGRQALRRLDPYLLLIVLLSLLPMAPMLQPGYQWHAHDARHSVYFLFEFDRGIQDGGLFPRWQPDFAFGYGYPFFNIYGPLAFYAGEALHLAGLPIVDAVKAIFALSITLSGLAMYGFVKQVLGAPGQRNAAGLVAAVAYMVMPYRLVDIYVRAGLAESVAYVWVPLVLWGTWATLHRPRLANVLGLALAYAALLFTHPLTVLLLTLILVFYVAFLALARLKDEVPPRRWTRESILPLFGHLGHILVPTAFALVLGLGLSAVFGLPAMTENRFVRLDQWYGGRYTWGGDFVEFFQLFSPRWGMGASVPGPDDQVSFQLGAVPVVLSLVAVVSLLIRRKDRAFRLIVFFAALVLVAAFLMLEASAPLWQTLPLVRVVQFPWRLLTLTVFSMAFLCGAVARGEERRGGLVDLPALVLVLLLLLSSLPYARAEMTEREVSLAGLMRFQQSADEMTGSTAWVREIPGWSPLADLHVAGEPLTTRVDFESLYRQRGNAFARPLEFKAHRELVEYQADRPVLLTFNVFYYPGWHAYLVDRETNAVLHELPISLRGKLGLITVRLPEGTGRVLLRLENTPLRSLGTAMTFASLALIAGLVVGRLVLGQRRPIRGREASQGAESLPGKEPWPDD